MLKEIDLLEQNLNYGNPVQLSKYYSAKSKWETLEKERIDGIILISKAKYAEEGEKSSKYFLNLEKRNYNKKHMKSIINSDGIQIND